MTKLEKSALYSRSIRKDGWDELGISTWTLIKKAIEDGKRAEALELVDYLFRGEHGTIHHGWSSNHTLGYIAKNHGEEEVAQALRWWRSILQQAGVPEYSLSLEELIQYQAEEIRACLSGPGGKGGFTVTEEDNRYVVMLDPCGSSGRMRRLKKRDPSFDLATTKEPHFWTWGKANLPYYCARCCIWWEIMPIEQRGYPIRVHECPDDPYAPCYIFYYKKPESIPGEYFERLGLKKAT